MRREVSLRGRTSKVSKGNQQAAQVVGLVGSHWYRAQDGSLINIELAQKVDVVFREDEGAPKYEVVASYNDGSEAPLGTWADEAVAWAEVDRIAEAMIEDHKIMTTRVRLGMG